MKIEVWSDFVCPFCYIGKRKLEIALEKFPNRKEVIVEYKSFELAPDTTPNPDETYYEVLVKKYNMSMKEAKSSSANISEQGADVGLNLHFDTMKPSNTFAAHRVAKYAAANGKANEWTGRIFRAYFTDSERVGDESTLTRLAGEIGLDQDEVAALFETNKYMAEVREDQEQAKQIGVRGVPFYVFNEKYALSGGQPVEAFSEVLEKVWEEESEKPVLQSLNPKESKATYCTDDGCEE